MDIVTDDLKVLQGIFKDKKFQENRKSWWDNYFEKYEKIDNGSISEYRPKVWHCAKGEPVESKRKKLKKDTQDQEVSENCISPCRSSDTINCTTNLIDESNTRDNLSCDSYLNELGKERKRKRKRCTTIPSSRNSEFRIVKDVLCYPSSNGSTIGVIDSPDLNENLDCRNQLNNKSLDLLCQEGLMNNIADESNLSDIKAFIEEKLNSDLSYKAYKRYCAQVYKNVEDFNYWNDAVCKELQNLSKFIAPDHLLRYMNSSLLEATGKVGNEQQKLDLR